MKICLLGYGKMGKAIETIATKRGHECKYINSNTSPSEMGEILDWSEIAIEFSKPELALKHIEQCSNLKKNIVVGTTGWHDKMNDVKSIVENSKLGLLYSSNFSIGVNIFFQINILLARLLNFHPAYSASMEEIHHTQKLDSPSGTAISLSRQIIENNSKYTQWEESSDLNLGEGILPIHSIREDNVVGTHSVDWKSDIDRIFIRHEAFNRSGFALGAVVAAEWLLNKSGIFTMNDVLNTI